MNGGALSTNAEPPTTPAYFHATGGWVSGTCIFTPTDGRTTTSFVNVGDFAHVFPDGGTTPTFYARVVTVAAGVNGAITLSTTVKQGTSPTTGSAISINVGGAWLGPNGATGFPLNVMAGGTVNSAADRMRINLKNNQTYSITANIDINQGSGGYLPITIQGYTSSAGDLGRAVIDGGTTGASYNLLILDNNAVALDLVDLIFDHNGSTGTASGVALYRGAGVVMRCTFRNMKGFGFENPYGAACHVSNCDAYANGTNGFNNVSNGIYYRCISSRNGQHGFSFATEGFTATECIAVDNTATGFNFDQGSGMLLGCISYRNGQQGFFHGWRSSINYVNCIAAQNTNYGFCGYLGSVPKGGFMQNCGTYNNTSGATNLLLALQVTGAITFASQPFTDPANGDFRLGGAGGAAAIQAGFGNFQWADTNYTSRANNVAYPDVGAVQAQSSGGGPLAQLKTFGRGSPY